eukprot:TRINITY_DN6096_c0_g1_i1.p1 TRINITY_DN6096_c0_g1~~TRINITY_DN6096_c0_g1_i1.p1  ORF type:complete len:425 (+),score=41.51 TRINITY_DN6096_c0_g1_i1:128-1402(+)
MLRIHLLFFISLCCRLSAYRIPSDLEGQSDVHAKQVSLPAGAAGRSKSARGRSGSSAPRSQHRDGKEQRTGRSVSQSSRSAGGESRSKSTRGRSASIPPLPPGNEQRSGKRDRSASMKRGADEGSGIQKRASDQHSKASKRDPSSDRSTASPSGSTDAGDMSPASDVHSVESQREVPKLDELCIALNKLPEVYARCTEEKDDSKTWLGGDVPGKNGGCFTLHGTCSAGNTYIALRSFAQDRKNKSRKNKYSFPFVFLHDPNDQQQQESFYLHDYVLRPLTLDVEVAEGNADNLKMQWLRKQFFGDGAIHYKGSNFDDPNHEGSSWVVSKTEQLQRFDERMRYFIAMPMLTVKRLISGTPLPSNVKGATVKKGSISFVMFDMDTKDAVHLQFLPHPHEGDELTQLDSFLEYSRGSKPKMRLPKLF